MGHLIFITEVEASRVHMLSTYPSDISAHWILEEWEPVWIGVKVKEVPMDWVLKMGWDFHKVQRLETWDKPVKARKWIYQDTWWKGDYV